MRPFEPHPLLRNAHAMTIAPAFLRRRFPGLPPAEARLFEVESASAERSATRLRGDAHWQPCLPAGRPDRSQRPVLVLVHGLEGSSESSYMLGIAEKAFRAGFNVLRMNQRNCGGTENLTPTLYNSGLSADYAAILHELIDRDGFTELFFCGYSMGGNLVTKMAGELGSAAPPQLKAVGVVCPALDLAAGADAISEPRNFLYEWRFVGGLKARARRKASLFPGTTQLDGIKTVRTVRDFDDRITAPNFDFRDADDYYFRASALRSISGISVPTLILTAKDDPIVPYATLRIPAALENPNITMEMTDHGGHCAYISRWSGPDRFWAEARLVEFFNSRSCLLGSAPAAKP
jgi:uncharacterized protein